MLPSQNSILSSLAFGNQPAIPGTEHHQRRQPDQNTGFASHLGDDLQLVLLGVVESLETMTRRFAQCPLFPKAAPRRHENRLDIGKKLISMINPKQPMLVGWMPPVQRPRKVAHEMSRLL